MLYSSHQTKSILLNNGLHDDAPLDDTKSPATDGQIQHSPQARFSFKKEEEKKDWNMNHPAKKWNMIIFHESSGAECRLGTQHVMSETDYAKIL